MYLPTTIPKDWDCVKSVRFEKSNVVISEIVLIRCDACHTTRSCLDCSSAKMRQSTCSLFMRCLVLLFVEIPSLQI